jgi:L-amino acid N-acyltransferase YncA
VTIWSDGQQSQGHDSSDVDQAASAFCARIASKSRFYGIWIGEIEGRLAGWQSLHPARANPIHKWAESSTYIAKEWKGCGIGRKLLTFATEHARVVGLSYIVGFIKKPPIKLIESLGWKKVGVIPRMNPSDIEWLYYAYAVR